MDGLIKKMDKIDIPSPSRPVVGGTNKGTRPHRYAYWRTGYGEREPEVMEFWIAQAGEYHCQGQYFTGDFEHGDRQQYYYHISGKATLTCETGVTSLTRGDLLVIPPQTTFTYQAETNLKFHWLGLEGSYPAMCRHDTIRTFSLGYDPRLADNFESIRETLILQQPGYALRAIGTFYEILAALETIQSVTTPQSLYPDTLRIALTYIQEHYQEPFEAAKIAQEAGISASYLRRLFHQWVGTSPHQSQIQYRIKIAKRLLATQNLAVQDVARQVGYQDPLYFSRVFKRHTGMRPSEFVRQVTHLSASR